MTALVRDTLAGLAATLANLKARVRAAVAGELAKAISTSVYQVVEAVAAGRPGPPPPPSARERRAERWGDGPGDDGWGRPADAWGDDPDPDDGYGYARDPNRDGECGRDDRPAAPPATPAVSAAVAAGVHVARWWVGRAGTRLAAAGLGLGVGLLGVFGGPACRAAVAVLAAAADLLAGTDTDAGGDS